MDELPPSDPILIHHQLIAAAAMFLGGVALIRYRQAAEQSERRLSKSGGVIERYRWCLDVPAWLSRWD